MGAITLVTLFFLHMPQLGAARTETIGRATFAVS